MIVFICKEALILNNQLWNEYGFKQYVFVNQILKML